jgi:hypothetical protein
LMYGVLVDMVKASRGAETIPVAPVLSQMGDVSEAAVARLARAIDANRLTLPVYQKLEGLDSGRARELSEKLKPAVAKLESLRHDRDALIEKLVGVLEAASIDYVVFKTVNKTGWVGVDVDVMIGDPDYDRCVRILRSAGFLSVDDVSKRYATGFMVKGNELVVDLHTKLTVLGLPYFSSDTLLRSAVRVPYVASDGQSGMSVKTASEPVEAVVRMAHSVIKEGQVNAGDIVEVSSAVAERPEALSSLIKEEDLQLATSVFSYVASKAFAAEAFEPFVGFYDSPFHGVAKAAVDDSLRRVVLPFAIPVNASILSLLDRLQRRGELSMSIPAVLRNLGYSRNAAHLGRRMLGRLSLD